MTGSASLDLNAAARDADLRAWLGLLGTPGTGRVRARQLVQRWGSPTAALEHLGAMPTEAQASFERSLLWLAGSPRRSVLMVGDPDYPAALLAAPDAPLLLFLEGERAQLGRSAVAIVGSRSATPQGHELANQFAQELAAAGWVVVSGLAAGIDGSAHRGALHVGGATWAVLGSGLDMVYPKSHVRLAAEIAATGLLISEHAPGTPPLAPHFPVRNRVIAGLSQGCLVVEAALKSGSLITARLALEAGREVFALPGPIRSPQAQGCNALIQQGAQLVQSSAEILAVLVPQVASATPAAAPDDTELEPEAPEEDPLLAALGYEPSNLDALQARTGWLVEQLLAGLLTLELAGQVRSLPGGRYERAGQA